VVQAVKMVVAHNSPSLVPVLVGADQNFKPGSQHPDVPFKYRVFIAT
jgi:hypothetical protein